MSWPVIPEKNDVSPDMDNMVLKRILQNQQYPKGKWALNWQGPYVMKKAFSRRALILTDMDGNEIPNPINFDVVKKYYA